MVTASNTPSASYNTLTKDQSTEVYKYHGLLVADQIRKIAPEATIVLVEVFNDGETDGNQLAGAIDFVMALAKGEIPVPKVDFKIDPNKLILNMSLGFVSSISSDVDAAYLLASCERACEKGAIIVAAAGNDSGYLQPAFPQEPAAYGYFYNGDKTWERLIAVAASQSDQIEPQYAMFSNHGNIAAPGYYMEMDTGVDPARGLRYISWAGTSFATGVVSGQVTKMLSDGVSSAEVKQKLWEGATKSVQWGQAPVL